MRINAPELIPLVACLVAVPTLSEAQSPPSNIQFGVGGAVVIEPGNSLVNGLGGAAGFGERGVAKADDGYEQVDVSAVFENGLSYFGTVYDGSTGFFVGRNGYVTLGVGSGSFTPWGIAGSTIPIIAPFFSDVDTRPVPGTFDAAGNSTGTNQIWVDVDPVADVVTITFDDVGEYSMITSALNAFQIRLWDLGGGDFGIEYRYEWMAWADHDFSWATAGWSAGDLVNFFELPASGNAGMLDLETSSNIAQNGVWYWQVTGGSVGAFQASVLENSAAGTVVGPLRADDTDLGDTLSFTLLDDAGGRFVIANVGADYEVQVAPGAALDYEAAASHTIRVRATDGFGLTYDQDLTIPVGDDNEAPTDLALSALTLAEDAASGTTIGTLSASDPDAGDTHTFSVVTPGTPFTVVGTELRSNGSVDFEAQSSWALTLRGTDAGGLTFDEVFTVQVTDVNEAPTSVALSASSIAEDASIGSIVGTLSAVDQDVGDSHTYALVTVGAPFTVVGTQLRVAGALDFETSPSHALTVRVTDGGGLTWDQPLTVTVTNTNEPPTGVSLSVNTIAERSALSTPVGTLSAVDPDAGDSHTFALVAPCAFRIQGALLLVDQVIDYEAATSHVCSVRATDAGGLQRVEAITILVQDVNDPPTAVALSNDVVSEAAAVGAIVGTLSTTDQDVGDTFTYTLLTAGTPFVVVGGELRVASALDFEAQASWGLTIRSTDTGGLTRDATFTVQITDVNEAPTAPVVSATPVPEDAAVGALVGTISATDPDAGDSVVFSLVGAPAEFSVSGNQLRVAAALDFEQQAQFVLTVRATDNGGLTRDAPVTIDLVDVNEAPTDLALSAAVVDEDAPVGALVGALSAVDPDFGDVVTFSLITPGQPFAVLGDELRVGGALDFETQNAYALTLRATDAAGLTFDRVFTIAIADVNDAPEDVLLSATTVQENSPLGAVVGLLTAVDQDLGDVHTFALQTSGVPFAVVGDELRVAGTLDFETTASYDIWIRVTDAGGLVHDAPFTVGIVDVNDAPTDLTFVGAPVAEDAALGTTVGTLSVTDVDAGDSHVFSVVGASAFTVVGTEVQVASPLDFESSPTHAITLRVTDSGGLTFDRGFTVVVTNVNEAPTAVAFTGTSVAENAPVGTVVGALSTTDQDVPDAHVYTLVGAAVPFVVDGDQIVVSAAIDYEQTVSFDFVVRTTDLGGAFFEETFSVAVDNENDNEPVVAPQSFSVSESAASGTFVGRVAASDADGDSLQFTLVSGGGAFTVASNGDLVVSSNELDYEVQPTYALAVGVSDGTFTTTVAIEVALLDENDTRPSFVDAHWLVSETASVGYVVGTLSSVDPDGVLRFAITAGNDEGIFAVDSSSGQVTVADPTALDFESTRRHRLRVTVDDGEQSTQATAYIAVKNENDNAPIVLAQTLSLPMDALPGDVAGRVAADDLDGGPLSFSLVGGIGAFGIDREQGDVVAVRPELLDKSAVVLVVAVDDGVHRVEQTVRVNRPESERSAPSIVDQVFRVSESAAADAVVGRVVASHPQGYAVRLQIVGGDPRGRLVLDSVTGALTLAARLSGPQHLTVRASDGLSAREATIAIEILEENDHAPRIEDQVLSVAQSALPNDAVGPVVAVDEDQDALSFGIVAGDALGRFAIDAAGVLSLAPTTLVGELPPSQVLTVAVGDGVHTATAAVTVHVTAFGTRAPVLASRSFTIAEDASQDAVLGSVEATDADGDTPTYALLAGGEDGLFTLDAVSGEVRLSDATRLDYEARAAYTLLVSATDGWNVAVAEMHVDVLDVNDEPPHLAPQLFSVSEIASDGTMIGNVVASDPEGTGLALRLTDATGAPFALDAQTGALTVADARGLDYEMRTGFVLEVAADDGSFTEHAFVTVRVAPENDNIPVAAPWVVEVSEDTAPGTLLGTMSGTDSDGDSLTWIVVDGNAAILFTMNASGDLTLAKPLDFETQREHSLVVQASDGYNVTRTTATVRVTNVNDVAPSVEDAIVEVARDAEVGSTIGTVVADDAEGDALTFSIEGEAGPVSIDATTGTLRLEAPLSEDLTLTVSVDDGRFVATGRIEIVVVGSDVPVVVSDNGCSCATTNERRGATLWSVLALAFLVAIRRRRTK